jgi:hypothetical protein
LLEPAVVGGEVEPAIADELPGLGLLWCAFDVAGDVTRRSPEALRARLRGLSDRHRGATAIALRSRTIPHAYRALFRHLGLDPDVDRIPVEGLMIERLTRGAYRSRGLLADALTVATLDTEVGVWAIDGEGPPLRLCRDADRIVVAGAAGVVARLFAPPPAVTAQARRLVLYAITAPGVPRIAVEEALLVAWDIVESG